MMTKFVKAYIRMKEGWWKSVKVKEWEMVPSGMMEIVEDNVSEDGEYPCYRVDKANVVLMGTAQEVRLDKEGPDAFCADE